MFQRAFAASRRGVHDVWQARRVTATLVIGLVLTLSACAASQPTASVTPTATSAPGHIDEFAVLPSGAPYDLLGITAGPDGALWVTYSSKETSGQADGIARITPTGTVSRFPLSHPGGRAAGPEGIASGPDGALWFTEAYASKIGRITTAGAITEFTLPASTIPHSITAGPDGALWFTESGADKIGRITTAGVITEFALASPGSSPYSITSGPDGALWFTQSWGCTIESPCGKVAIGRITTAGAVTEFPSAVTAGYTAMSIVAGSDGALWFTEETNTGYGQIGHITPPGSVKKYPIPTADHNIPSPAGIAAGPDGALWFTEDSGDKIGRITTGGAITEFALPTPNSRPWAIAAGPDGALWFTELEAGKVGRITA